jgi:hypothetical protein
MPVGKKKGKSKSKSKCGVEEMVKYLSEYYGSPITYTCQECLKVAYKSAVEEKRGYVTDEELIACSRGLLRHK